MNLEWIRESPARWDEDKKRIIGDAPVGIFDRRYRELHAGELLPAEWWRVESDGRVVGYGWMDVVWGDAEILLATSPDVRDKGVGSFILRELEREARASGLRYLYNVVRPTHPNKEEVTSWLRSRRFQPSEDGSLLRALVP